ncbi:MAG TPA: [protein-PII] uridylyltransferase [Polyangiaceae bacterium]|nr:[protein-PII] uridylyltransferase [Polyangiaceae bacterium]
MTPAARSIPPTSLETTSLRRTLERHRAGMLARLAAGEDGSALGRANARFLNECFRLLFQGATRRAGLPGGVALAATGSFGRGAVALRSDADVLLVVDPRVAGTREASSLAEALLYPLWDAGITVGHQVLDAAAAVTLARSDLATATELLDLRLLAGDEALFQDLATRASEGLFAESELDAFIDRLEAEAAARHERFGGSVYLLEPEVKNGPGGLRDLDGVRWAARARYRVADPGRAAGAPWADELVRLGVLVAREARELGESEEFLWRVRNHLHARAGRRSDRLGFEDQEALGLAFRYGDDRAAAAEGLMQAYYRTARKVSRARAALFERMRPPARRATPTAPAAVDLGAGVHLFDGRVTIAGSAELLEQPVIAMRALAVSVRQHVSMLPFARDAIARAADEPEWCERLRADREAADLFVELVCTVPQARVRRGSVLGELHDLGLLVAMIPEFSPVTGRVHHDVYHVYTVDVHSVAAVDRLRQLARGELAREYPVASRLAAEIARPRPLFLATLLHDVGKGYPDASGSRRDHSRSGEELCGRILPRLGLSPEEVDEARRLVRDHLVMYHVATRRDLDDRATIEEFCRSVRGREGLRDLYLLTVADVSTTSPTAMTTWKARMLEELYFASEAHFIGRKPSEDAERLARARDAARAAWIGPTEPLDALLASLPERYLIANRPEQIVQHARAVSTRGGRPAHVVPVSSRHADAAELCIVADDRPGLLAAVAAALTANRLEVLKAEVYSHPVGVEREALDLFWVRDRDGGVDGVEAALPRLASDLVDVCSGRVAPGDLLRARTGSSSPWRERPTPAVATEVSFDSRASPRHTIVEVYAKDRPGLLHALAQALHDLGLSITLSKINTEGARVADVFYVTEADGTKVAAGARQRQIQEALVGAAGG